MGCRAVLYSMTHEEALTIIKATCQADRFASNVNGLWGFYQTCWFAHRLPEKIADGSCASATRARNLLHSFAERKGCGFNSDIMDEAFASPMEAVNVAARQLRADWKVIGRLASKEAK